MNLSNLVHGRKVRQPVAVDYLSEEQFEQQRFQAQKYPEYYDNSFAGQYAQPTQTYSYVQVPQPPPSPPMEEIAKCSLPSISSLLGIADNNPSQQQEQSRPMSQHTSDGRKNSAHYTSSSAATTPRQSLPLTPPTHPDSAPESHHSPSSSISSTSQYSCASTPAAYSFQPGPTTNAGCNPERDGFASAESRRASVPLSQPQYGLPPSTQRPPPPTPGNTTITSRPPPPASPSRKTATSAQPATKPSRVPPASKSTATATQARSPSAAPSADAERNLASGVT
ncbi:hypothetical protein V493_07939 [Pseudogymnoascus sp. VKM F-4281 (FW-2241)]|nr:hypothetical protein V493_07939 [Pseudogymnoascus sp. VKM F-4281 (FW-2241)]